MTPYYNKCTQKGLIESYTKIADATELPMIVYNVPGRTGTDIPVSVYQKLSTIPNIAGVKEASTDIVKIARIRNACPPSFQIWSGNDEQAVAAMAMGAQGLISVVSNVLPVETQAMTAAALAGDFDTASALQCSLLPLIDALFREVNPIPVKAAMARVGFDCGSCRLPLTPAKEETVNELKHALLSI